MISPDFAKNIRFNGRKIPSSEIVKKETILNKCHVLNRRRKHTAAMKFAVSLLLP